MPIMKDGVEIKPAERWGELTASLEKKIPTTHYAKATPELTEFKDIIDQYELEQIGTKETYDKKIAELEAQNAENEKEIKQLAKDNVEMIRRVGVSDSMSRQAPASPVNHTVNMADTVFGAKR